MHEVSVHGTKTDVDKSLEASCDGATIGNRYALTSLERFLLRFDDQAGSMVFRVNVHLDGRVDTGRLQDSARRAVLRHPLLRSRVGHGNTWLLAPNELRFAVTKSDTVPCPTARPLSTFDIRRESGVDVHVAISSDGKALLSCDFHHAATDGQGAGRYVRDVLSDYFVGDAARGGERLDPQRLCQRGLIDRPSDEPSLTSLEKLRNLWTTVRGRNLRFPYKPHVNAEEALPPHATAWLDEDQTIRVREMLQREKRTLNDVALAALFPALASIAPDVSGRTYISVMNPVDLRGWSDRRLSASNRFGFAYVRRQIHECRDPARLLDSVVDQMTYVRRRHVAAELIAGVELVERVPGLLSAIESSQRFVPTANFTCMSNSVPGRRLGLRFDNGVWHGDGVSLRSISGYGPLPPNVPLSLALCDGGAVISLNVRGRSGCLSRSQVGTLAQRWREHFLDFLPGRLSDEAPRD